MTLEKYNIAFIGRIKAGTDIDTVKASLAQLIKKDSKTIDALFSGKRVVLKKDMDREGAEMFKAVFEKTGAICEIQVVEATYGLPHLEMEKKPTIPKKTDKPSLPMGACPQCGHEQVLEKECRQCGVIFDKYKQKTAEPPPPAEKHPPISEEMEEGIAKAKMIGMMHSTAEKKRYKRRKLFKLVRIALLLSVLGVVAAYTTLTNAKIAGWKNTLNVVIYPINGDRSAITAAFIQSLDKDYFSAIEFFMSDEADSYDLPLEKPVTVQLAPELETLPPAPPSNRNPASVAIWSLKLRYWAFKHSSYDGPSDIRIYVVFKAMKDTPRLELSVGLRKGLIGIVNTASGYKYRNDTNIVVTHELLHTLGATDKYDYETLLPVYPDGYAQPDKMPRYPQIRGEIMAVRVPLSESSITMPATLNEIIIGEKTCTEIKWCREEEL